MTASLSRLERYCLVTVGATVGFPELTEQVLQPAFWRYIHSKGFTSLHIQCGPDLQWAAKQLASLRDEVPNGLNIDTFDVRKNLMKEEMVLCKAADGCRSLGLIISHAGTGTILDAWKLSLPVIVVPNPKLLDNHQTEMARHLSKEGYAIMSSTRQDDLQGAIDKVELLWEENKSRWPAHDVNPKPDKSALRLWDITPQEEVEKEENAQMAHD